ncbi:DNRLRE domain-containing protein [Nonomuraea sp. JJY05]|uniref:DNRLRE domain-containing protein n=1 Tax=Nonomuraea sp. JJY05 TaxID=3350255 RepID=UPI00373E6621
MTERPDRVSAALTARLQGRRILVTDETTESTLTYVNPDGTITLETASGPVRVKQGDRWNPIDTTLVAQDGVLKPKSGFADVEFSAGGGDKPLAVLERSDKQSYTLTWPNKLPQPKVEGNKATYPDAAGPGADLVLTALPAGFRHDIVLRQRPTGPVEYKIPIRTKGLELAETKQGGLKLTDGKGKIVASAPQPVMYDTRGRPEQGQMSAQTKKTVAERVVDTEVVTDGGHQALVLRPDLAFLADPETSYPVTVDPTTTLPLLADMTIFSSNGYNQSLGVGTMDQINPDTRTFTRGLLKFDTRSVTGQVVTDARLELESKWAWGCVSGQTVKAQRITSDWSERNPGWGVTATSEGEQAAREPGTCTGSGTIPSGTWTWNVTAITRAWAAGAGSYGIMLRLATEDATPFRNQYERHFDTSEDAASGGIAPKMIITFGSTPSTGRLRTAPVSTGLDSAVYTNTATPMLLAEVQDPDGGLVRAEYEVERDPDANQGSGLVWSGSVENVASGTDAKVVVPAGKLADGQKLRWRARAFDGVSYSAWSAWQKMAIDTTAPAPPTISCDVQRDTWYPRLGDEQQAKRCWIAGLKGNNAYLWSVDDPGSFNLVQLSKFDSEVNDAQELAMPAVDDGWHTLYVKTRDNAHNTSTVAAYSFGIGPGGFVSPKPAAIVQRQVTLSSTAPSTRTSVRYEYLDLGSFKPIPATDVTPAGSSASIGSWPQTRTDTSKNFANLTWDVLKTVQATGRRSIEGGWQIRACFGGTGQTEACTKPATITVQQSAFNPSQATAEIGPGKVALQTGDYSITSTDASLFGIAVSRTHTSLVTDSTDPLHIPGQVTEWNIFGPDWRAGFPSAPSAIADFEPQGDGSQDTLTLTGPDGSTLTYLRKGETFYGVGDAADGSRVGVNLAEEQLTVTEADGSKTTYTRLNGRWVVARAQGPAAESTVLYFRDIQGRITRVLAPTAEGVTCDTLKPGCRVLELSYASTTTATGVASGWGDFKDQVKTVSFTAFDPEANAMKTTVLASYLYDSTGHLRRATDPRTNLATDYYYTSDGRISQIASPGLAPWRMEYDSRGRLAHVQREGGDVDPTQAFAYDVPIGGTGAPIDLTQAQAAKWGQATDLPAIGTALFPASHLPARSSDGAYRPGAADWEYAKLAYMDVNGRAVNGASFGSGTWQLSAVRHDDKGNAVWELSSDNLAQALAPTASTDPYVAGRSDSAERANLLARTRVYNDDSDLIAGEDQARQVMLADGTQVSARPRTTVAYDEGKPTNDRVYHLVTSSKTEPVVLDAVAVPGPADIRTTKTGYDPVRSGDTSGWDLRLPTSVTTVMPGQQDITTRVRYDPAGREIERRMPKSAGADAGTTIFSHYTAGPHPSASECGSKPWWAGLKCRTGPAAQPAGKPLPTTVITYAYMGQQATLTDTSGSVVRTSTIKFDSAGRPKGGTLTVTPESEGGHVVPEVSYSYDPNTGLQTHASAGGVTVEQRYDTFGRIASVTDADNNTSTTTYTVDGQIATVNDGKGLTTYTYNGTDAAGRSERRGLPTKIEASGVGAFAAAYDAGGRLSVQTYPNGLSATYKYDNAGKQVGLAYAKNNTPWLQYSRKPNLEGLTVANNGPGGSSQRYTYDAAGRLTTVADTYAGKCVTREYGFDQNTNRTSLSTYGADASGGCSTSTNATTESYSYDAADRITSNGYVYDNLGRTLNVPGAHIGGGNDLQIEYYANDMVASLTQSGQERAFTLDPVGRIRSMTKTGGSSPQTMVNHYAGTSDSPSWIAEPGGTWTRNIVTFTGLAAVQKSNGSSSLQLTNLHGDIVAICDNSASATGIASYFEQTEYGVPRIENASNPERYGWIGEQQRSVDSLAGLVLMGARLYNPVIGRFLQVDPVLGGSANKYEYCSADPINCYDLDGKKGKKECGFWCELIKGGIAAIVSSVFGAVCAAFTAGVGAVLCAVVAGGIGAAVDYLAETYITGEPFSWSKFRDKAVGGLVNGLVGGSAGAAFIKSAAGKKFGQAIVNGLNTIAQKISDLFGSKYARFFTWLAAQLAIVLGGAGWACGADMKNC